MKKFIFIFIFILLPSKVFAEYILKPANCTLKKQINCGAYLYNNKNGVTYFCTLEECKEIMGALEEVVEETQGSKESKKSKIPKFKKKEKKKSKIPKFKKSE